MPISKSLSTTASTSQTSVFLAVAEICKIICQMSHIQQLVPVPAASKTFHSAKFWSITRTIPMCHMATYVTGKYLSPSCILLYIMFQLSLSLRFNGHFPGEPGSADVYWSKGWWRWWWQLDYWSYKTCKALAKSSPPTNQHPVCFTGRMPFLSPNQQCQSTEGKNITFHGLTYPKPTWGSSSHQPSDASTTYKLFQLFHCILLTGTGLSYVLSQLSLYYTSNMSPCDIFVYRDNFMII